MGNQIIRRLDQLARDHTEDAIDTIVELMNSPVEESKVRLAAAKEVLDRGHGKPLNAVIQLPASRQHAAMLAAMSDDELMARLRAPLPMLADDRDDFIDVPAGTQIDMDPLLA